MGTIYLRFVKRTEILPVSNIGNYGLKIDELCESSNPFDKVDYWLSKK